MALERYHEKRDFRITPEPRGRVAPRPYRELSFVIQKHAASHLHYDFRLELNGVLLSWAVPKGPSLDPADKRLAMHVEDHPIEYGSFEGIIPAKQYGGGTVLLWDRGTWIPKGDPAEGYAKGRLKFELNGEKLKGGWMLVKSHSSKYGGKTGDKAWLLIKENDSFAERGADARIVDEAPDSVLSGRSLDDIAAQREHVWHSTKSVAENVRAGAVAKTAKGKSLPPIKSNPVSVGRSAISGARVAKLPATLSPMLATLVDTIPKGDDWLHEVKFDGYRMLCRVDQAKVKIFSRSGKEWTAALPRLADAVGELGLKSAWLDGEVTVVDERGRTSFQSLQNALSDASGERLNYFVFDVLYLDGYDLQGVPLLERKRLLRTLIPEKAPSVHFSVDIAGSGEEFFKQACALGLEGAVSKRANSVYRGGVRTRDWVKVKCAQRQEMVIGGFTDPQGSRSGFGALLLGVYEAGGKLRYSGKVGTGFNDRLLATLRSKLDALEQDSPPFANPPRGFEAKDAHWVNPKLVAEVAFTEWTQDGTLRHPAFQGLREDKNAADVVRERPVHEVEAEKAAKSGSKSGAPKPKPQPAVAMKAKTTSAPQRKERPAVAAKSSATKPAQPSDTVAGVKLSHPDKLLYPESKLSKLDLARYYESIGDWIVPHLRGRPLSLVRCPDGWSGQCFYQKNAPKTINPAVGRVLVPESSGTATYMTADSVSAIAALVQWGVLELHPWGSCKPRLDRPDRLIFDFDPDDAMAWEDLVSAVGVLRALLEDLGLAGFLKTTGGKGLHVVVPIRTTLDWDQAKGFTKAVADLMARTFPDRFLAVMSKSQRKGKIFIDYLRNASGATAIAPYSLRARANAPAATPITWDELATDVRFDHFNLRTVPPRLAALKSDPWKDFLQVRQTISKAMFKRVGYRG
ncbi:MAG: DNA ligase D [Pseudomonadota bacterium]|nr:DNA ligase D [Pseudomonadota bacterium]